MMTTNDRSITEQLPDLPALESVDAGPSHTWPIAVIMLGMLYLFTGGTIWFVRHYEPYLGEQLPLMNGVAVILVAASLWMTARLLLDDHRWSTTPEGLYARAILRRRFVRWDDVREASSRRSSLHSTPAYTIRTSRGRFQVYPVGTYSMIVLYASVWQHLRRVGKADGLELPQEALSIWDSIPDELPREMDWADKRQPLLWPNIAVPAVFMTGALWFAITEALDGHYLFAIAVLLAGSILPLMFASLIREMLASAKKVSLCEDRLEAVTRRGPVTIPWNDVRRAKWDRDSGSGCLRILIGGGSPYREVGILYKPTSEESSKLILVVIRRLRTAGTPQALVIPDPLRSDPNGCSFPEVSPTDGPAELRLSLFERLGFAFMSGLLAGMPISLLFVDKPNPNPWQIIVPCIAAFVLGSILSGSYRMSADADGVSKRFMFWTKSVSWREVAGYSYIKLRATSTITQHLLRDERGRILINIAPGVGSKCDQQRFLAYVHARLGEVLPADALNPPWKARPWTPE